MKAALVFLAFIVVAFASGGTLAQPEAATILQEAKIQFSRPLCASKKIPGGLLDDVVSGVASGVAGALVAAAIAGGDVAARTKPVGGGQAAAKDCISLEGLKSGTVEGLVELQAASKCQLIISKAISHEDASNEFGYSRGYRVNVLKNSCLNNYIRTHYTKVNGAFENADGDKFIEHTYVWEIVFF